MLSTLKQRLKNRKGFTLIELIVVIAIIAILAAVLIPRFAGFTSQADESAAISTAKTINTALHTLLADGDIANADFSDIDESTAALTALTGSLGGGSANLVVSDVVGNNIDFTYTSPKGWVVVYDDGTEDSVTAP